MYKALIFVCLLAVTTGCATGVKKSFRVLVDPPDARIRVIPGGGQPEQQHRSPADVIVTLPKEPAEAAKGKLVIERDAYKPVSIFLNSIYSDTIRLRLEKLFHYKMKFRMVHPILSEDLIYQDRVLAVQVIPNEQQIEVKIRNLTDTPLSLLWEKSDYTDQYNRTHRIVRSNVKLQDRVKLIPPQVIPARGVVTEQMVPVDNFVYSQIKDGYELKPLFLLDDNSAAMLKGKSFGLFLAIDMKGAIIPDYNFRIEVADVVRER